MRVKISLYGAVSYLLGQRGPFCRVAIGLNLAMSEHMLTRDAKDRKETLDERQRGGFLTDGWRRALRLFRAHACDADGIAVLRDPADVSADPVSQAFDMVGADSQGRALINHAILFDVKVIAKMPAACRVPVDLVGHQPIARSVWWIVVQNNRGEGLFGFGGQPSVVTAALTTIVDRGPVQRKGHGPGRRQPERGLASGGAGCHGRAVSVCVAQFGGDPIRPSDG